MKSTPSLINEYTVLSYKSSKHRNNAVYIYIYIKNKILALNSCLQNFVTRRTVNTVNLMLQL